MSAPAVVLLVPGRLETRTGGYEYDRRMVAGLRARGWPVEVRELDASFPHPTPAALDHAAQALSAIADGTTALVDGLALGAMPDQVEREARRLRIVALVHMPLAAGVGLDVATAARFEATERRALATVARAVVTGRSTIATLTGYGVAADRITVIEPGTDRAPLSRGSQGAPLQLLCVATINAGKGHEVLVRALATMAERAWHLTCVGSLDRDASTVAGLRAMLRTHHLEDRVSLVGEQDDEALDMSWDRADVFVLATLRETYGMAVAEALAHGLPVISTTTGAIPELVGRSAGVLVPPGDTPALANALSHVLGDIHVRERLAEGARRVRDLLPTWDEAFGKMAAVLESVATGG